MMRTGPTPVDTSESSLQLPSEYQLTPPLTACWASAGYHTQGCAALENSLRACMDKPKESKKPSSPINYHLGRMKDRVVPHSKDVKPTKRNL